MSPYLPSDIGLDPRERRVNKVFDHDLAWWENHVLFYALLNPDSQVPTDEQIRSLFSLHWFDLTPDSMKIIYNMRDIIQFWIEHPSMEELLCS